MTTALRRGAGTPAKSGRTSKAAPGHRFESCPIPRIALLTNQPHIRGPQELKRRTVRTWHTTLLGITPLTAGVVALAAANGPALAVLFGATMALWVLPAARRLFATAPMPGAELGPDTHEVIEQPPVRH